MQAVVNGALKAFDVRWCHVTHVWEWESLKNDLPSFNRLRTIHAINVFRQGGIFIKWKQYMTDESWSRPILLVPGSKIQQIASLRPDRVPQSFGKKASAMLSWVDKFETLLADSPYKVDDHRADLEWLRRVIRGTEPTYISGLNLGDIVEDLRRLGNAPAASATSAPAVVALPEDQLVQLFPGADHVGMPQDLLVAISGVWEPALSPDYIAPGMFLICRARADTTFHDNRLLFTLGRLVPDAPSAADGFVLVSWWVPPFNKAAKFKPGRRKNVLDYFGAWRPFDDLDMTEVGQSNMPPGIVNKEQDVLLSVPELEADGTIPYICLDSLRSQYGIDMTGLSVSSTTGGSRYRNYVLFMRAD